MLHKEIERRFLLNPDYDLGSILNDVDEYEWEFIQDIYFNRNCRIRFSSLDGFLLTIKFGYGLIRTEFEIRVPGFIFRHLFNHNKSLCKSRCHLVYNGIKYALNDFLYDLVTIEVEFDDEVKANSISLPDWVGREVTNDRNFNGYYLFKSFLNK